MAMAQSKADFYVATDGNDAWSGTLPEPNVERTDGPPRLGRRALGDPTYLLKRAKAATRGFLQLSWEVN